MEYLSDSDDDLPLDFLKPLFEPKTKGIQDYTLSEIKTNECETLQMPPLSPYTSDSQNKVDNDENAINNCESNLNDKKTKDDLQDNGNFEILESKSIRQCRKKPINYSLTNSSKSKRRKQSNENSPKNEDTKNEHDGKVSEEKNETEQKDEDTKEDDEHECLDDQIDYYMDAIHSPGQLGWCDVIPHYVGKTNKHIPTFWPVRVLNQDETMVSPLFTPYWNKITAGEMIPVEVLGFRSYSNKNILIIKVSEFVSWNNPRAKSEKWREGGIQKNAYISDNKRSRFYSKHFIINFKLAVSISEIIYKQLHGSTSSANSNNQTSKGKKTEKKRVLRLDWSKRKEIIKQQADVLVYKEKVKEKLIAGDTIKFFYIPLNRTFETTVTAVNRNSIVPIVLANNLTVDLSQTIRRTKNKEGNPVHQDPMTGEGMMKPLSRFHLVTSSVDQGSVTTFYDKLKQNIKDTYEAAIKEALDEQQLDIRSNS
ncbi:hypothetical protein WA158_002069 [Blastocystis sp. Blastoise]